MHTNTKENQYKLGEEHILETYHTNIMFAKGNAFSTDWNFVNKAIQICCLQAMYKNFRNEHEKARKKNKNEQIMIKEQN